jgi:hypothetical protein
MPRTAAPANKKTAVVAKAPKDNSAAPVEKIIPLTGQALKAKLKELSNLTKTETAKGCGYYSVAKDGTIKVNLRKFYDAVLHSEGINVDKKSKPKTGAGATGREASYRAIVHANGNLVIGAAYTRALNLSPGDEFEIKLGRKHINLKAIAKEA